jgi:hypothetical protein
MARLVHSTWITSNTEQVLRYFRTKRAKLAHPKNDFTKENELSRLAISDDITIEEELDATVETLLAIKVK